jgi:hypothetical protein
MHSELIEQHAEAQVSRILDLTWSDIPVLETMHGTADDSFCIRTLIADWACYGTGPDRVEYPRLRRVIASFPQGFRLYTATCPDGTVVPVGYTAWYPISEDIFATLKTAPHRITHRGDIAPVSYATGAPLYLFNYSIIPALHKTSASRQMLQSYATEITAHGARRLSAVTVSKDGARVARRFGMTYRGDITHDGVNEQAYLKDSA